MWNGDMVVYFSTAEQTLEAADALIALAEEHPDQAATLTASAVVAFASTLDQGTKGVLDFLLRCAPYEGDLDTGLITRLRGSNLFERVRDLPAVMSRSAIQMRRDHSAFRTLRTLITLRNRLAHPEESVGIAENVAPISETDDTATFEMKHIEGIAVARKVTLWTQLSVEDGIRFQSATHLYFEEVLSRPTQDLVPGELLAYSRH